MIDDLDRKILHALHLDPRVPYARLGAVLGVSEQTVARRYQRMRGEGIVRVVGLEDPWSSATRNWTVRLGCRPGTAAAMATALAARPDVRWVSTAAGGSELTLQVAERIGAGPGAPGEPRGDLLDRLPHAGNVLSLSAHQTLHHFHGRGEHDWIAFGRGLTREQWSALVPDPAALKGRRHPGPTDRPPTLPPGTDPRREYGADDRRDYGTAAGTATATGAAARSVDGTASGTHPGAPSDAGSDSSIDRADSVPGSARTIVEPEDRPLLDALARDGRAGYAALAADVGWTARRVAHRIEELTAARALFFDIDVAITAVGFQTVANLWLTVDPARLDAVGTRLADHPESAFVAAVTGRQNVMAAVVCLDGAALYRHLTGRIAGLDGVREIEVSPIHRRVKQAGSLIVNGRLTDPARPVPDRRRAG